MRLSLKSPTMRLVLDGTATVLLVLCLAYWWLGNLTHELAGSALFVLVGRHMVSNLYWWKALRKGPYDVRRAVGLSLTLSLLVTLTVLLVTSFAISRSLFAWLPLPDNYTIGEIHMFAAYWLMAIAGLHIGLNWRRVSMFLRSLGLQGRAWTWGGWVVGLGLAGQGLRSASEMGLWPRLRFDYSLVMWDFNDQALAFFGHWFAIVALFAFLGHGTFTAWDWLRALHLATRRSSRGMRQECANPISQSGKDARS